MGDFEQLGLVVQRLQFGIVTLSADARGRTRLTVEETFKDVGETTVAEWLGGLGLEPPYQVEVRRQDGRITLVRVTCREPRPRQAPRRRRQQQEA